jgi:hypothetical protein
MKIAVGLIEGHQDMLRMMGILLIGSTAVFCNNQSVVKNSTAPESVLNKQHSTTQSLIIGIKFAC